MDIKNNSDKDLEHLPICIIESVVLWTKKSSVEVNRIVAGANFPSRVKKRASATGNVKLRVPALWPSSNGRTDLIEVNYYLAVLTKPMDLSKKTMNKPIIINLNDFDKQSRVPIVVGTVPFKDGLTSPPAYNDLEGDNEELPDYDHLPRSSQDDGIVVELDSRRLTLPAIVPELDKSGWYVGNLLGSLLGF